MIRVLRPGVLTTVQDGGRPGWRHLGVPLSGALDADALYTANLLLGNPGTLPGLELTLGGTELLFEADSVVALAGADLSATFHVGDQQEVSPRYRPLRVRAGTVLRTGQAVQGARLYLAVAHGLTVPRVLGSASTYTAAALGGLYGGPLRSGDHLTCQAGPCLLERSEWRPSAAHTHDHLGWGLSARVWPRAQGHSLIRAVPGPDHEHLSLPAQRALWNTVWTVTPQSDRMGMRLRGTPMTSPGQSRSRLSSAVFPGTVQLPTDGQTIVLLADGQTVGGYPCVAQVCQADLPVLGQLRAGDEVSLTAITPDQARAAYLRRDRQRRALASAATLRWGERR